MSVNEVQSNKTFTDLYGDHLNNVVVFGDDSDPSTFHAHAKLEFWGEDAIHFSHADKGIATLKDDVVTLDANNIKHEWFQQKHNLRENDTKWSSRLHWVFTLKSRPANDGYELQLGGNWQDFNFWRQPIWAEDPHFQNVERFQKDGEWWVRCQEPVQTKTGIQYLTLESPENIQGSYAVYHKTKKNHRIGDKNYRTGKALHIVRPKAVDAAGKEAWGDLLIENGLYRVTFSKSYLDQATYPIRVNDEFGYHTVGGAGVAFQDDWMIGDHFTTSGSGTGVSIFFRGYANGAGLGIVAGLYDNSDPGNLITNGGTGAVSASYPSETWNQLDFGTGPTIANATTYRLGLHIEDYFYWRYDAVANAGAYDSNAGAYDGNAPTNPDWDDVTYDKQVSCYCEYTAGGGQTEYIAGTADAVSSTSGALTVKRMLSGSASAVSGASAKLSVKRYLSGSAAAQSGTSASLSVKRMLSGSASAVSAATAALTVKRYLSGSASAQSGASASLSVKRSLSGSATAASTATAALSVKRMLSGSAAAISSTSATLSIQGEGVTEYLSGSATAVSSAWASLTVKRHLSGSAAAASAATAKMSVKRMLSGSAAAVSGATASLTVTGGEFLYGVATIAETESVASIAETESAATIAETESVASIAA